MIKFLGLTARQQSESLLLKEEMDNKKNLPKFIVKFTILFYKYKQLPTHIDTIMHYRWWKFCWKRPNLDKKRN